MFVAARSESRVKRQEDEGGDEVNAEQLCEGRPADEYFRLTIEGDCRDVVRLAPAITRRYSLTGGNDGLVNR